MGGGRFGPPMGGGGFMPGAPMGGFGPMGGSGPSSGSNRAAGSHLRVWHVGNILYVSIDAEVNAETDRKIRQEIEGQVVRLKGMTDVAASGVPRWHELAATALRLKDQKKVLHGTHPLAEDASGKSFVMRGPNQRVSWMVELLPALGKAEVYNDIDSKLPWRHEKNLRPATTWIPQFINPQYPRESWQARLPSLSGYDLGVTHYTALSGIGLDSAEWDENDPAVRKKLGLFGYDRSTKFDDIHDGASNTIFLITTPPNVARPWIAGGGATVQGVPEKNSIAPFVANHGGKRGAYVLMADGSVRFVAADVSDKVFQAMVTKAGDDDVGDFDAVAPKVAGGSVPKPAAKPDESAAKKPDPPK
jgi:prepilin-type processing-associated H-X9-DG protein